MTHLVHLPVRTGFVHFAQYILLYLVGSFKAPSSDTSTVPFWKCQDVAPQSWDKSPLPLFLFCIISKAQSTLCALLNSSSSSVYMCWSTSCEALSYYLSQTVPTQSFKYFLIGLLSPVSQYLSGACVPWAVSELSWYISNRTIWRCCHPRAPWWSCFGSVRSCVPFASSSTVLYPAHRCPQVSLGITATFLLSSVPVSEVSIPMPLSMDLLAFFQVECYFFYPLPVFLCSSLEGLFVSVLWPYWTILNSALL